MQHYYELTFIQVLIEKFVQSQTFNPDWPELSLISAELGTNREKIWFSRPV